MAIVLYMPLKEFVLAARTKQSNKSVIILSNVNTLIAVFRLKKKYKLNYEVKHLVMSVQ